jgi:hypothetical protein
VAEQKERDDSFEVGDSLISYPLKQDSLQSESDSIGAQSTIRTSSIRWKEQLINGNAKQGQLSSNGAGSRPVGQSRMDTSNCDQPSAVRPAQQTCAANSTARHERVQHINLPGNMSISLEDLALPGDSGSGVGLLRRQDSSMNGGERMKKTWSFDDLRTIKSQLNRPPDELFDVDEQPSMMLHDYATSSNERKPMSSHRTVAPFDRRDDDHDDDEDDDDGSLRLLLIDSGVSPLRHFEPSQFELLRSTPLSRQQLLDQWRVSEQQLLASVRQLLLQRKALQRQCARLHKMIDKS